ncbi:HD domain-containing phosphohydrolase [Ornithinibacillus halophilus]|uniref:7TM diverse intracellular signalling n=1 Tax=Ornithinibacillus halophilus TaxID=930117 RepID=A0A1M5J9U7_9BACI|nr:HD domain-containing phosphohydrolase [Ornithinibacillus halophilus]SHG37344.1 7TM diverse intracellular signalling [Ornithinibacillus halophilus]
MKRNHIIFSLYIIIITFLVGCQNVQDAHIKSGQLTLLDTETITSLNGEWHFYPNELVEPSDFQTGEKLPAEKISVPGTWEKNLDYGTYQLHIHYPDHSLGSPQAMNIPQIFNSYKLFINGELILENGTVGNTEGSSEPLGIPTTVYFTVANPKTDILIQVSNFHNRSAGIPDPLYIGNPTQIEKQTESNLILEWFSIGAIIAIALMHITVYWYRKTDTVFLYFGLFCLFIGLRVLLVGQSYIFHLFPFISWRIVQKLNYSFIFVSIPLFIKYFALLFPNHRWKEQIYYIALITSVCCTIFIFFTNVHLFTNTAYIMYPLVAMVIAYLLYILYKAILRKEVGAKFIGIFLVILLGTVINDLLYNEEIVQTMILMPIGLVAYCGAQAYVISVKYSDANIKAESLNEELETTQSNVIFTLGQIIESRSNETGYHVRRVAEYSKLLALKHGMSSEEANKIKIASVMHDVGKVAISDDILLKPGKLTEEEYTIIQAHTSIGYDLLKHSKRDLMKAAAVIAYTHHERFDGTGYPRGLKGEEIPLYGRIVAIVDVFDALGSDRVYKKAWKMDDIITYFQEQKGKQFDPKLIDIFLTHIEEFIEIKEAYRER